MRRPTPFARKVVVLWAALVWGVLLPAAPGATVAVSVRDTQYIPNDLTVFVGDTVVWQVRQDSHTVTPDSGVSEPFCGTRELHNGDDSCTQTFSKIGTFSYHCFYHGIYGMTGVIRVVAAPNNSLPTITLSSPASGATVSATPTNTFTATATDSDGTVKQVEFFFRPDAFANLVSLGVVTNSTNNSFTLLVTNTFPIGANLSAVAKATDDRGGTTTSSTVNFNAGPQLTQPTNSAGQFQFQLTASNGLTFILQGSTNLTIWVPLATNTVTTNGLVLVDPSASSNDFRFYRVLLRPN